MQALAAAQAGVSVIQPNIGRLHDWYVKHPGFPRDPKVRPTSPCVNLFCIRASIGYTLLGWAPPIGKAQRVCGVAIDLCVCYLSCTFLCKRFSSWPSVCARVRVLGTERGVPSRLPAHHITGRCTVDFWPCQQLETPVTQGPREDTGFKSDANPGIAMVERIYNLCHQAYPKTKVMVSGIRKPEGARP